MLWILGCGMYDQCLGCYYGVDVCLEGMEEKGCCRLVGLDEC